MRDVQVRLDGKEVITDAQATDIKALVQAIAKDKTAPGDNAGTQYRSLWSELYRRFRVPSYARIKQAQYHEVIAWLEGLRSPPEDR
jgi:alpha-glucuronidase